MNEIIMDRGPMQWPTDAGLIAKWQHSIVQASSFVSEWEAQFNATELAWEVRSFDGVHAVNYRSEVLRRYGPRRPRNFCFSDEVQINFCLENSCKLYPVTIHHDALSDWDLKPWSLENKSPMNDPDLALSDYVEEYDTVSMLAHAGHGGQPLPRPGGLHPVPGHPAEGIAGNRLAAQQPNVAAQDPDPSDEDEESDSSHESDPRRSWQSAHVFRPGRPVHSFRVRWDNYEALHRSVARGLRTDHHEIAIIYEVSHAPTDLATAGITPLLVRMGDDLGHGDTVQLI